MENTVLQSQYSFRHRQMADFFASGATLDVVLRQRKLQTLHDLISGQQTALSQALRADLGKCPAEAYITEIGLTLTLLRYYISRIKAWSRPRRVWPTWSILPALAKIHPEPFGLALILSPWNYPFQLSLIPLISAVAAGNCVVLKPSRQAPATGEFMQKLIAQAFEPNHCRVILDAPATPSSDPEQTANDLLAEQWDFIFYTGSARVGHIVMASAARHLTPLCLELGGQSPVIVAKDANLPLAAKRIAWGKILNAGQTCVAPDYVLAQRSIRDELLALINAEFCRLLPPDPLRCPDYGHIVSAKAFTRLCRLAQECRIQIVSDEKELKIAPVAFAAPQDSPALAEEIFGPLLPVLAWDNLAQAIKFIKSKPKPLACYLFTSDESIQKQVLQQVSFGGGCINDVVLQASSERLPFGGVGNSGLGRYHGRAGFDLFSNLKSVVHQWPAFDLPLRYPPYSSRQLSWIKRLLR